MGLIGTLRMIFSCKLHRRLACETHTERGKSFVAFQGISDIHNTILYYFVSDRTYKGAKNTMNDTMLPINRRKQRVSVNEKAKVVGKVESYYYCETIWINFKKKHNKK